MNGLDEAMKMTSNAFHMNEDQRSRELWWLLSSYQREL